MTATQQGFRTRARAQAEELVAAIATSESVILATIERECAALRAGQMLAAKALHTRLTDAARLYLNATKAARASLMTIEHLVPGTACLLDERRRSFAPMLRVGLTALAAERALAATEAESGFHPQVSVPAAASARADVLPPADTSTSRMAARLAPGPREPEQGRRVRHFSSPARS